jgi:hypothetical protein
LDADIFDDTPEATMKPGSRLPTRRKQPISDRPIDTS